MSERYKGSQVKGEQGMSLITVMMVLLIMTLMGISILAITGSERQIAGSVSASEASVDAAESCVSTGANVLQHIMEDWLVGDGNKLLGRSVGQRPQTRAFPSSKDQGFHRVALFSSPDGMAYFAGVLAPAVAEEDERK